MALDTAPHASDIDYEDSLGSLQDVPGSAIEKGRWIVGGYQASDAALQRFNGFFPFRLGSHTTGPLGIRAVWPGPVLTKIRNATRPTFFLVHLLIPHGPYLYRKDGSIRPMEEWSGDRADRRLDPSQYREHYSRYCEQTEYLSGQLRAFFDQLRDSGNWDSLSIVVHGDHGEDVPDLVEGLEAAVAADSIESGC